MSLLLTKFVSINWKCYLDCSAPIVRNPKIQNENIKILSENCWDLEDCAHPRKATVEDNFSLDSAILSDF